MNKCSATVKSARASRSLRGRSEARILEMMVFTHGQFNLGRGMRAALSLHKIHAPKPHSCTIGHLEATAVPKSGEVSVHDVSYHHVYIHRGWLKGPILAESNNRIQA